MDYLQAWNKYGRLTYEDLPDDVKTVAHQCVLDWFGCALAGSREPLSGILRDEFSHRQGRCQVLGSKLRLDPATAALLNGASGHALDYDDTSAAVGCHATAPVWPAVMAIAEEIGASGAELMTAFVVGVEIEGRIGNAIGAKHYLNGWHTTATYGTFGAAAGVAHLLKLDAGQYAKAMALAASAASGVKANFGTMTKPYHAGQAAERGLIAARLAARGFTASADAVNGKQGYVQAAGIGSVNSARLEQIADSWLILDSLFKYHAACYLTHATIDSVKGLRKQHDASSLKGLELSVNPSILDICGICEPKTGLEGKFSLRANAALAWLGHDTSNPETYADEVICRDDVQATLAKVRVSTDESLTQMQTRVHCATDGNDVQEAYCDTSVPCRDLSLQGARLEAKFDALSAPLAGDTARLCHRILRLADTALVTDAIAC
ncbi:MAG: MmgE/PrpD family protein [Gammaproteobacteria bacterium]|nr:MmgE/PrpD family protein [Gammaproteobacteria bacterium]